MSFLLAVITGNESWSISFIGQSLLVATFYTCSLLQLYILATRLNCLKKVIWFMYLQARKKGNPPKNHKYYECLFVESVMEYISLLKLRISKILVSIEIVPVVQLIQKVQ